MLQSLTDKLNPGDIILIVFAVFAVGALAVKFLVRRKRFGAADNFREAELAAEEIMFKARTQAARVIEEANKKAAQILSETKSFSEAMDPEFRKMLRDFSEKEIRRLTEASEEIMRIHRSSSEEARKSFSKVTSELFDFVSQSVREGTRQFLATLTEELKKQEGMVAKNIDEWNVVARRQIDDHKKGMIARINDSIYDVISFVSKEVLGKSLSIEDHGDLIIRALEEAKKEGFFEK